MTLDLELELANYRAHRFGITRLEDGTFALFEPSGDLLAMGTIEELASLVLTGPEHYETCIDRWITRLRKADIVEGNELLAKLGLVAPTPAPSAPILRRI